MKVIVFGATGRTGKLVVEQALEAGHVVTAVARNPSAVETRHKRLTVVQGNVLELPTIESAMRNQEAAVLALNNSSGQPSIVHATGSANIIQAMKSAGAKRLVCVSASGLDPGGLVERLVARFILWQILRDHYNDLAKMEANVKDSGLDWTIVRPPRLLDSPRTGQYKVAVNSHLRRALTIARADVADYIVRHLEDTASYCAVVEIAY